MLPNCDHLTSIPSPFTGYGEKFLLAQAEDDDDEQALKMDDEVKVAPWNTTRAYLLAMKQKCLLQVSSACCCQIHAYCDQMMTNCDQLMRNYNQLSCCS